MTMSVRQAQTIDVTIHKVTVPTHQGHMSVTVTEVTGSLLIIHVSVSTLSTCDVLKNKAMVILPL